MTNSRSKAENGKDGKVGDFGPQITSLTNFVIREQGKCFELARTGRELILLLREENNQDVENILTVSFCALGTHICGKSTLKTNLI